MKKSALKSAINRSGLESIEENIFKTLNNSNKPLSTQEIASNLNKSCHTIIRHCLDMEIKGKIYKFSIGRVSAWQIKR